MNITFFQAGENTHGGINARTVAHTDAQGDARTRATPLRGARTTSLLLGLLLSACASVTPQGDVTPGTPTGAAPGTAISAPSLGLFSSIRAPRDTQPVLQLSARGVQIFRCEKRDGAIAWIFRQPEAQLADATGRTVARHGANFSFEHVDGSRLVATVAAYDDPPNAADLRWLLMTTRSYGAGGFGGVTHVQRVNTRGGMPPARCEAAQLNQLLRVDFSADFVFYRPASAPAG